MELIRFLTIIERVIISVVIAGFIPLTVLVFICSDIQIPTSMESTFSQIKQQAVPQEGIISGGFIVESKNNCSQELAKAANQYCFEYCSLGADCSIVALNSPCQIGVKQFSLGDVSYCASKAVKNQINSNKDGSTEARSTFAMATNISSPPLFLYEGSQSANTYFVLPSSYHSCKDTIETKFTAESLSSNSKILSERYIQSLRSLYYTLVPIFAFTVLSALVETCTKFEFKKVMQVSLFMSCIISISIIVIGIEFDSASSDFEDTIKYLGGVCLSTSTSSDQAVSWRSNLQQDLTNGLTIGFTIFMGAVCVIQVFLMALLLIVWVVEFKLSKIRKEEQHSSHYELQTR